MKIGRTYWKLQKWIAPGLANSQYIYRDVLLKQLANRPRWLDLGCGHQFLPDWIGTPDPELLSALPRLAGVDGDLESIRRHALMRDKILADAAHLPFAPRSFDLVTANMVMEHVANPEETLAEANRVLSPGGVFLFHTPNVASPLVFLASKLPDPVLKWIVRAFEGRDEQDVYPTRYRINTRGRVAELGSGAGFRVEEVRFEEAGALTAALGPLAAFELVCIRLITSPMLETLRPVMIATLRKPLDEKGMAAVGADSRGNGGDSL